MFVCGAGCIAAMAVAVTTADEPNLPPPYRPPLPDRIERILDTLGVIPHDPTRFVDPVRTGRAD
jgi:hypothetical protein